MTSTQPLRALASHCAIADDYVDVWGQAHPTTDATARALLAAMHLPINDSDPAGLLRTLEEAAWQRSLPPVLVRRQGQPIRLELGLPATAAQAAWRWRCQLESGEVRSGEFIAAELQQLGLRRIAGLDWLRCALDLPGIDTLGYHRLELAAPDGAMASGMTLIIAPATCHQPASIRGPGRVWGPIVQLYGLRSRCNWGIGDFSDLRQLLDVTAAAGGSMVGINPLHALFPDNPGHISPYSPSSRSALNPLYIDVLAMLEFRQSAAAQALVATPAFQDNLQHLRTQELLDYPAVAAAKFQVLKLLYLHFREHHLAQGTQHAAAFLDFCEKSGETLARFAQFEALQAHFRAADQAIWGWPVWPLAYRQPDGPAVAEFARQHSAAVQYHAWLQWVADGQLAAVAAHSRQRGLGIGIYADFAVGVSPGGADAWRWQGAFASAAYTGAPPEEFNLMGQDWGLPPFVPQRLQELAYAPLIEVLRHNMRHAGALRIDHVMSLTRLFWVPAGRPAAEGAYVAYPQEDLLGIVALESQRHQCLVIGEDLGTVPAGLRQRLASAGLLSYRPLLEARGPDAAFLVPDEFPQQALVAFSSHDMPTLAGFWQGRDLAARSALHLFPSAQSRDLLLAGRAQDRARLLAALAREKLLPEGAGLDPTTLPELTTAFALALYAYLARTPCQLLAVQLEDILGQVEQINLPGTYDSQHPNWRRRLTLDLEDWPSDGRFQQLGEWLRRENRATQRS